MVIELKLNLDNRNNWGQLLLELLGSSFHFRNDFLSLLYTYPGAAEDNKRAHFKDLRVHGLLTDLSQFCFYSYDPVSNEFCMDETIIVGESREEYLSGMIHDVKTFTLKI